MDDTTATINLDKTVAIEMKPLKKVDKIKMSHPLFQLEETKTDLKNLMEDGPTYNQALLRAAWNSAKRNLMTPDEVLNDLRNLRKIDSEWQKALYWNTLRKDTQRFQKWHDAAGGEISSDPIFSADCQDSLLTQTTLRSAGTQTGKG